MAFTNIGKMSDYRARSTSVGDCMNELSITVSVLRFADCFYQAHPGPLCDVIKPLLFLPALSSLFRHSAKHDVLF